MRYLHGYTSEEQDRLYEQARFVEPLVYEMVDFSRQTRVLEVGCGVGAQLEILLKRFPHLSVTGIDRSTVQLDRARNHLAEAIRAGRASLGQGDATALPCPDGAFDGAFACWFLEHVQEPVKVLREARRVLKPGGVIYCTEVNNASLYVHPEGPALADYWEAFNRQQLEWGGDPYVGPKLANLLLAAGYRNVQTRLLVPLHGDNRLPELRARMVDSWVALMLSAAPALLNAGRTTPEGMARMRSELERVKDHPEGVFFYVSVQARAEAP